MISSNDSNVYGTTNTDKEEDYSNNILLQQTCHSVENEKNELMLKQNKHDFDISHRDILDLDRLRLLLQISSKWSEQDQVESSWHHKKKRWQIRKQKQHQHQKQAITPSFNDFIIPVTNAIEESCYDDNEDKISETYNKETLHGSDDSNFSTFDDSNQNQFHTKESLHNCLSHDDELERDNKNPSHILRSTSLSCEVMSDTRIDNNKKNNAKHINQESLLDLNQALRTTSKQTLQALAELSLKYTTTNKKDEIVLSLSKSIIQQNKIRLLDQNNPKLHQICSSDDDDNNDNNTVVFNCFGNKHDSMASQSLVRCKNDGIDFPTCIDNELSSFDPSSNKRQNLLVLGQSAPSRSHFSSGLFQLNRFISATAQNFHETCNNTHNHYANICCSRQSHGMLSQRSLSKGKGSLAINLEGNITPLGSFTCCRWVFVVGVLIIIGVALTSNEACSWKNAISSRLENHYSPIALRRATFSDVNNNLFYNFEHVQNDSVMDTMKRLGLMSKYALIEFIMTKKIILDAESFYSNLRVSLEDARSRKEEILAEWLNVISSPTRIPDGMNLKRNFTPSLFCPDSLSKVSKIPYKKHQEENDLKDVRHNFLQKALRAKPSRSMFLQEKAAHLTTDIPDPCIVFSISEPKLGKALSKSEFSPASLGLSSNKMDMLDMATREIIIERDGGFFLHHRLQASLSRVILSFRQYRHRCRSKDQPRN